MVDKRMTFSSSGCAEVIKSASIDCKDLMGQLCRYERQTNKMIVVDDSESLSDIDDEELSGYINSNVERDCKKALWEEMNRDLTRIRGVKRTAEAKKAGPVKKALKVTVEAENQKVKAGNRKGRSSKINYDALEELGIFENVNKENASPRSKANSESNATAHSPERENCDDDDDDAEGCEHGEDATYKDNGNGYGGGEYGYEEEFYEEY